MRAFDFFFCSTLSEFENFLLCERILINHNLSKRNVKLILKNLSDLEPLRGSSNKKTLHSTMYIIAIFIHNHFESLNLPEVP
jgi:hypothetical protein